MSLTKQIANNTIAQISGKALSTVLGLIAVFIMTRSLGAEKYGWYSTVVGFLQFVGIFSDFGFTIVTATMLSEPKFDKQKLLNNLFTLRLITAIVFQGAAPFAFLLFPYPAPLKIAAFITSFSFFAIYLSHILIGHFQHKLQTYIVSLGEVVGRVALVAGLGACAYLKLDFIPMMTAVTAGSIINFIFIWAKGPKLRIELDKEITRAILIKMWPTALAVIFNAFYLQGDKVILPLYAPAADVGLYGAAYRVLDIITQVSALIMGIMQPLAAFAWSRNQKNVFNERAQISFDLTMIFLIPMMFGVAVLSEPIMRLVGGEEFADGGKILFLLSPTIFGICLGQIFGYLNLAINRQKTALVIYISDAILSVVMYMIFIPKYGIYGAAGVSIFSEIYAGIGLMVISVIHSKFMPNFINLIKIVIAGACMYAAIFYIQPANIFISIALGAIIYPLLILLFKTVSFKTIRDAFWTP
jgi:O-antigen/teichoic acid export membrane protein